MSLASWQLQFPSYDRECQRFILTIDLLGWRLCTVRQLVYWPRCLTCIWYTPRCAVHVTVQNATTRPSVARVCNVIFVSYYATLRHDGHLLYIGWQWRNFFISYLCQLFFRHAVGQALRSVSYSGITFLVRQR